MFFCLAFEFTELKEKLVHYNQYKISSEEERRDMCYLYMRQRDPNYALDFEISKKIKKDNKPVLETFKLI